MGHFFDLFLGWVPLSAWIVVCVIVAAPILFYAGPVLLPIWRLLPSWLKALILGIGAALLAYAGGRYKGAKTERDERARREAGALQNREQVNRDVDKLSEKDTRDQLARWNRDDS